MSEFAKDKELWMDSAFYAGTVLVSFGIGWQLDEWLGTGSIAPLLLYAAILFLVYVKWILRAHR